MPKKNDKQILCAALKQSLGAEYKVHVPQKMLPKLKVVGIKEEFNQAEEDEFLKKVCAQNDLDMEETSFTLRMIKKIKTRNENKEVNIILEVDPKTQRSLVEKGRMKVGWKNCGVYDYVSIVRCFKCWGFSHYAAECRNETSCRKCAGNHTEKDCNTNVTKCINCIRMIEKFNITDITINH